MNAVTKHQDHHDVLVRADRMVAMIERLVMNADADLDKLERMLAMKERIDALNDLITRLTKERDELAAEVSEILCK